MLPSEYALMDTDTAYWDEIQDDVGASSNPGEADPNKVQDFIGGPVPARAHVIIYSTDDGGDAFDSAFLFAFAMIHRDARELQDWLQDDVIQRCAEGGVLVLGNRVAVIGGSDGAVVADVTTRVAARSGAIDWCVQHSREQAADAVPLPEGRSGPYEIAEGESLWFEFVHGGGLMDIESDGGTGDSLMQVFDQSFKQVAEDDDGGDGTWSHIEDDAPAGTYYLRISGWDGQSVPMFYVTWTN